MAVPHSPTHLILSLAKHVERDCGEAVPDLILRQAQHEVARSVPSTDSLLILSLSKDVANACGEVVPALRCARSLRDLLQAQHEGSGAGRWPVEGVGIP